MKKILLIIAFLFSSFLTFAKPAYKSTMTEMRIGNNTLLIRIFSFDELKTGKMLAEKEYGIKNFDSIVKEEDFVRLQPMDPGSPIHGWEYGMFKTESEFWVFRNRGDGFLYGIGRYTKLH